MLLISRAAAENMTCNVKQQSENKLFFSIFVIPKQKYFHYSLHCAGGKNVTKKMIIITQPQNCVNNNYYY